MSSVIKGTGVATDLLIILAITTSSLYIFSTFDVLETIVHLSSEYERYEIDELVASSMVFSTCMLLFALKQIKRIRQYDELLSQQGLELKEARIKINALEVTVPICSHCKNVRNSYGEWLKLETYIDTHSEGRFSSTICPDCVDIPKRKLKDQARNRFF
ncbi:MAG: hypothetical protein R8M46_02740 [Ghiorsea sp.]